MSIQSETDARNAETSRQEAAAFKADTPSPYFAYHDAKPSGFDPVTRLWPSDTITTWAGEHLATVDWTGQPWRSNFGDVRQNFTCKAINGSTYHGTAYLTAGNYVRMRKAK